MKRKKMKKAFTGEEWVIEMKKQGKTYEIWVKSPHRAKLTAKQRFRKSMRKQGILVTKIKKSQLPPNKLGGL